MMTTFALEVCVAPSALGTARPRTMRQLAVAATMSFRTIAISLAGGGHASGTCLASLAGGGSPTQSRDGPRRAWPHRRRTDAELWGDVRRTGVWVGRTDTRRGARAHRNSTGDSTRRPPSPVAFVSRAGSRRG